MIFNVSEYNDMNNTEKDKFANTVINEMATKYIQINNYLDQTNNLDVFEKTMLETIEIYLITYLDTSNKSHIIVDKLGTLIKSEELLSLNPVLSDIRYYISNKLIQIIEYEELEIKKDVDEFIELIKHKYQVKTKKYLTFIKGTIGKINK